MIPLLRNPNPKQAAVSQGSDYESLGVGGRNWKGSLWGVPDTSNILYLDLD